MLASSGLVLTAAVGLRATVVQHRSRNQFGAANPAEAADPVNSGILEVTNLINGGRKGAVKLLV